MMPFPTASFSFALVRSSKLVRAVRPGHTWVAVCAVAFALCEPRTVLGESHTRTGSPDLASQVRTVFAAKCAECHGTEQPRPRGNFGYVTDLQRMAENPALVVPFKPEESMLWDLIRDDEMPPADATEGSLSADEKAIIHAWIEAGASLSESKQASSLGLPAAADPGRAATQSPRRSLVERTLRLLGKLHVLVIHFPIALLMVAVFAEVCSVWCRVAVPASLVRFCIRLGAMSAVSAAALGWLHAAFAASGASSPERLAFHRWIGTAAALWATGLVIVCETEARAGVRRRHSRILLVVGALLVGVAAHLGGTLVYGEHYFDW
jgi:uncharacterized membrane protein/mono/diheme cytochrome c family protein